MTMKILALISFFTIIQFNSCENFMSKIRFISIKSRLLFNAYGVDRQQREYLLWKKLRKKFPEVSNLPKFFEFPDLLDKCFISIDNFLGINVAPLSQPIMSRRPQMIAVEYERHEIKSYKIKWTLSESSLMNWTFPRERNMPCPLSNFWASANPTEVMKDKEHVCLQLNFTQIISRSRPWTCQIYLGLYTPSHLIALLSPNKLPPIFTYDNLQLSSNILTATSTQLHLYIAKKVHSKIHTNNLYFLQFWMVHVSERTAMSQHIFVLIETHENSTSSIGQLPEFSVIQYCSTNNCFQAGQNRAGYWNFKLIEIPHLPSNILILQKLAWDQFQTFIQTNLEDRYVRMNNGKYTVEEFYYNVRECQGWSSIFRDHGSLTSFRWPAIQLAYAAANVWHSILKNYTIIRTQTIVCENGNLLTIPVSTKNNPFTLDNLITLQPYQKGFMFPPNSIQCPSYNLRFVSCGGGVKGTLPFQELINVYDRYCWLSIMAVVVVTAIPLRLFSGDLDKTFVSFLSPMKALLEQGNPFPRFFADNERTRIIVGTILLMCIVLSNAYKNSNMYNMILPRNPVPFETLQDLIHHNFTVYSRSSSIKLCLLHENFTNHHCNCESGTILRSSSNASYICVTSETSFVSKIKREKTGVDIKISKLVKQAVNFSALTPTLKHKLIESIQVDKIFGLDLQTVREAEEAYLYNSLATCKNTALILPESLCQRNAQNLKKDRGSRDVFVGKEIYSDIQWYFHLKGFVHPDVIRRYQWVSFTGIWEWWMKIIMKRNISMGKNEATKTKPKSVSIYGNVVIIFTIWGCGSCFAIFCFIAELVKSFYGGLSLPLGRRDDEIEMWNTKYSTKII